MAEVLVRDLDPMVVEKLKARAAANGRSLQAGNSRPFSKRRPAR